MKNTIKTTLDFDDWLKALRDLAARARIARRIVRAGNGNFGDSKLLPGTGGVYEMRIDYGPGYRVYYGQTAQTVYLLFLGGDKTTQDADIARAKALWLRLKEESHADGKN